MKKKYFVLRTDSDSGAARLEYFKKEENFKTGQPAKRSIQLKFCNNINRRVDVKQKFVIALYLRYECFSVVADTEDCCEEWLIAMLELQLNDSCMNGGATLKPKFAHEWQVTICKKSPASFRKMKGVYTIRWTLSHLRLEKMDETYPHTLEIPLMGIRQCGLKKHYFVIELLRSSVTRAGELWLETKSDIIAQNMCDVIGKLLTTEPGLYSLAVETDSWIHTSKCPNCAGTLSH
ncbi:hypothetical protein JTE90_014173 [Oedothorax gibbosus]|uniref:Insulin receptor substrate 1 n=1 Tax=Oedothorax gibbosus TaxID=931172 RepID=A0AAV6VM39_9ARAC|nr:hypothetical protein JTE90_014173 [Oedothorax gibbosus]